MVCRTWNILPPFPLLDGFGTKRKKGEHRCSHYHDEFDQAIDNPSRCVVAVADWPATAIVAEMRALLFVIGHAA
jgi:hypothetical protein